MLKKTKILFFLAQMGGGGAERVTINIIRLLDRGLFDIHLVAVSAEGPLLEHIPKDITLHDLNTSKTVFSILKLRKTIINIKPDVVYSTLFRTHQALYLSILGMRNSPKIVMRSPNSPKLLLENKSLGLFSKVLLEIAYARADIIIAQTPEMKDEIVKYHHINEKKVYVFLNPLDTDSIDKKIVNITNPFKTKDINVVAAGRLTKQKGFDVLIKAFKYIVEKDPDFVLHIVGDDQGEKQRLIDLVDHYLLKDNVNFLGHQKNPYQYFFFSDVFVLSSRWEGMPNTVIENLYLKKPVVATKCIPFMNELITNGDNGFLVDVDDSHELAKAILNYRKIRLKFSSPIDFRSNVNNFFTSIIS